MQQQIQNTKQQVQAVAGQAVSVTRNALLKGADLVAAAPAPTRKAVHAALELNELASAKAKWFLDAELDTFAVVTDLAAKRLKAAAQAEDLDGLVKGQVELLPEARTALLAEARKYMEMYFAAKARFDKALEKKAMALVTPAQKPARKAATPAKAAA